MGAEITNLESVRAFVFGGKATFTLVSRDTGVRFTYRCTKPADSDDIRFVKVLNGPDNTFAYAYIGNVVVKQNRFYHGRKAKISRDAKSVAAFNWFFDRLMRGDPLKKMAFWHEGRCGCCGRKLTVPESIETGFGPVCAGK